jgi:diguanylate cyclase (GGDEF)-like protein/PAS domain S-box-containing protein
MNEWKQYKRLDVVLVRLALLTIGLSLALWFVAGQVQPDLARPLLQYSVGFFLAGLMMLLGTSILLEQDLRRATRIVREGTEGAKEGRYLDSAKLLRHEDLKPLPGLFSGWSGTMDHLVGLLELQGGQIVTLLDEVSSGLAILTPDSKVLTANRSFCRIFDFDLENLRGKQIQSLLPPSLAEHWSPAALSAASWYGRDVFEARDPKSGRFVRTSMARLPAGKGTKGMLALVVEERVDIANVQTVAEESRRLQEAMLESVPGALMVVSAGGVVRQMNTAATALLGYSREEASGMPLARLLPAGGDESTEHKLDTYFRSGNWHIDGSLLEASFARKDGKELRAEVKLGKWLGGNGPLYLMILRDVTEERHRSLLTQEKLETVEMISTCQSEEDVLSRLTLLVERQLPGSACIVLLRRGGQLFPAVSRGVATSLQASHQGLVMNTPTGPGVTAASEVRLVTVDDLTLEPMREDLRAAALALNLQACWSMPVVSSEGLVVGAVVVYRKERGQPDKSQMRVLEMACQLVAICVEQRKFAEKLAHSAQHDSLTGLPNRSPFENWLGLAVASAKRHKRLLGVISVNLDASQSLNGGPGPDGRDKVLQQVGSRIHDCFRATDMVASWSRDEFRIGLLELKDREDGMMVADRLLAKLKIPLEVEGRQVFAQASVGVSLYPDDAQDPVELVQNADRAMYLAKKINRGGAERYTAVA